MTFAFVATLASAFSYPFDYAHTKIVNDRSRFFDSRKIVNAWDCFEQIPATSRLKIAYQGLPIQLVISLLYVAGISSILRLMPRSTGKESTGKQIAMAAVLCGSIGFLETVLYPLDTFKKCFQTALKPKFRQLHTEIMGIRREKSAMKIYFAGVQCHLIRVGIMMTIIGCVSSFFEKRLQPRKQ